MSMQTAFTVRVETDAEAGEAAVTLAAAGGEVISYASRIFDAGEDSVLWIAEQVRTATLAAVFAGAL